MRTSLSSKLILAVLSLSFIGLTACDRREQKVENIAPIKGSLLENGRVAPITQEGAAELKEMIANLSFVKQYKALLNEPLSNLSKEDFDKLQNSFVMNGEYEVYPRGDFYEVVFPKEAKFNIPEDERDGKLKSIIFAQNYTLKVRPTGDPAAFRVEFVQNGKPLSVVFDTVDGPFEVVSLTYKEGGEPFKALWHNDFQTWAQLQGSLQDLVVDVNIPDVLRTRKSDIDHFSVRIGNVHSDANMTPDENNIWSGPYNGTLSNLVIDLPQGVGNISVLSLKNTQTMTGLNPTAYKAFFTEYESFMQALYGQEFNKKIGQKDDGEIFESGLALGKTYKTLFENGIGSIDLNMTASDVTAKLNTTPENSLAAKTFTLAEFNVSGHLSGVKENKAMLKGGYELKGMNLGLNQFKEELGGDAPQEMIPQNINLSFGVENVPALSLFDYGIKLAEGSKGNDKAFEQSIMQAYPEMLDMLNKSGAQFKIDNSYVGNDLWLLLLNSAVRVDTNALYKAVGEAEFRFYGLDVLMQALDQRARNPETSPIAIQSIQQVTGGLGMMQMMGQQKKDDQNRDYRSYVITVSPEGTVEMNGTDMTQMMGMFR